MNHQTMNHKPMNWVPLFLSFLGIGLVILRTSLYGPGLTHDSISYYFAAQSFSEGNGFQYFGYPSPIIQWPILFPFIFGIMDKLGLDILQAARVFNALVFGATIFSAAYVTQHVTRSRFMATIASLLVLSSFPTFDQSSYFWTEPLFTLLGIWIFYGVIRSSEHPSLKRYAAFAGVLAGLSVLLRYAGATYVMAMCLCLMLARGTFKERFVRTFIFGFLGTLPFVLNVASNYVLSGTLMGMRTASLRSLSENIMLAVKVLKQWVLPAWEGPLPHLGHYGGLVALVLTALVLVIASRKSKRQGAHNTSAIHSVSYFKEGNEPYYSNGSRLAFPWLTVACFAGVYLIYMIASASAVNFDPIDPRYLQPIYLPLIFLFVWLVALCFQGLKDIKMGALLLLCLLLWQLPNVYSEYKVMNTALETGVGGANVAEWQESLIFDQIKGTYGEKRLYSNRADLINLYGGLTCYYTPKLEGIDLYGKAFMEKDLQQEKEAYVIWFKGHDPNYIYSPEQLEEIVKVRFVTETEAYRVYEIKPLY